MAPGDDQKLLRLLGLARRAGKLSVGFSLVEKIVKKGEAPLVLFASDIGAAQKKKIESWRPVRSLVPARFSGEDLGRVLGREKVVVVGLTDPGFIRGVTELTGG